MSKDKCQLEKVPFPGSFKKRLAEAEIKYQSHESVQWVRPASPGRWDRGISAQLDCWLLKQKVNSDEVG